MLGRALPVSKHHAKSSLWDANCSMHFWFRRWSAGASRPFGGLLGRTQIGLEETYSAFSGDGGQWEGPYQSLSDMPLTSFLGISGSQLCARDLRPDSSI